jgi:dihydrofolate reductase
MAHLAVLPGTGYFVHAAACLDRSDGRGVPESTHVRSTRQGRNDKMRKVILAMQVTLDGFIEGPNGELDWAVKEDEETWKDVFALQRSADTLLLGRVMYPAFEKYWLAALTNPYSTKNEIEYAGLADKMQKIVFSKTLEKVEWKTARIIKDHIAEEILKMKQQPGKDMVLLGGAGLVSTFMNLGLIDEYHLIVNPLVLGGGKPLFKDVKERHKLKLIKTTAFFTSGKVVLHYGKGPDN